MILIIPKSVQFYHPIGITRRDKMPLPDEVHQKLHGINPMIWMVDVLKTINNHPTENIRELLPHKWKKMQDEASLEKQENYCRKPGKPIKTPLKASFDLN